jgi:hypothetical protein
VSPLAPSRSVPADASVSFTILVENILGPKVGLLTLVPVRET